MSSIKKEISVPKCEFHHDVQKITPMPAPEVRTPSYTQQEVDFVLQTALKELHEGLAL